MNSFTHKPCVHIQNNTPCLDPKSIIEKITLQISANLDKLCIIQLPPPPKKKKRFRLPWFLCLSNFQMNSSSCCAFGTIWIQLSIQFIIQLEFIQLIYLAITFQIRFHWNSHSLYINLTNMMVMLNATITLLTIDLIYQTLMLSLWFISLIIHYTSWSFKSTAIHSNLGLKTHFKHHIQVPFHFNLMSTNEPFV